MLWPSEGDSIRTKLARRHGECSYVSGQPYISMAPWMDLHEKDACGSCGGWRYAA